MPHILVHHKNTGMQFNTGIYVYIDISTSHYLYNQLTVKAKTAAQAFFQPSGLAEGGSSCSE